jgi:hypothetical protein
MSPGDVTPPRDSKSALLAAARTAIQEQSDKRIARAVTGGTRTNPVRIAMLVLLAVAGAVLLLVRPAWLAGPPAVAPEPPDIAVASVRLSLLRERQRVVDFLNAHQRLPATLVETGSSATGITYVPQDSTRFHLSAWSGDSLITLHSEDGTASFLGSSLKALTRRGKP